MIALTQSRLGVPSTMPAMRVALPRAGVLALLLVACFLFPRSGLAHPASGIVVDDQGRVYFLYQGLIRIDASGQLSTIEGNSGGHWLALGSKTAISAISPNAYRKVFTDGDAFLYGDGAPLAIATDGSLYYGSTALRDDLLPDGATTVAKLSPKGKRKVFSPALQSKLSEVGDGVTALAVGPDGLVYVATWKGFVKLKHDGSIAEIVYPVVVNDCDRDPADHKPSNHSSPFFRGIGADSGGNVYLAATSCHRVLKIAPDGSITTILKSERPWAPTGIAIHGQDVYVLEYTNANGPRTEGWYPRVRRIKMGGKLQTLITVNPPAASAQPR
jgi:sugar lactone lactonase YvrE